MLKPGHYVHLPILNNGTLLIYHLVLACEAPAVSAGARSLSARGATDVQRERNPNTVLRGGRPPPREHSARTGRPAEVASDRVGTALTVPLGVRPVASAPLTGKLPGDLPGSRTIISTGATALDELRASSPTARPEVSLSTSRARSAPRQRSGAVNGVAPHAVPSGPTLSLSTLSTKSRLGLWTHAEGRA